MFIELSGFEEKQQPAIIRTVTNYAVDTDVSYEVFVESFKNNAEKIITCASDLEDAGNLINATPEEKNDYLKYDLYLVAAKIAADAIINHGQDTKIHIREDNKVLELDHHAARHALMYEDNQKMFLKSVFERAHKIPAKTITFAAKAAKLDKVA